MSLSVNYDDEVVNVQRINDAAFLVFTKRGRMFVVRFTMGNDFPQVLEV